MTRINCGVPVEDLTDKHLLAEHREIKRIPNAIKNGRYNLNNLPEKFTLGTGHVKFFYNKLGYLLKRYCEIHQECLKRNFKVTDFSDAWNNLPKHLMNDYKPTLVDKTIVMQRIKERLSKQ